MGTSYSVRANAKHRHSYAGQRILDVAISLPLSILLAPAMALIAVVVRISSPGPILYRCHRAGQGGTEFVMFKFRSMRHESESNGARVTKRGDSRITRVGAWLRKWKLDELPQLFNVLRGDMSIVGPRPEDPAFVALYQSDQRAILDVRPGITSPASVAFADEEAALGGASDIESFYMLRHSPAEDFNGSRVRQDSVCADRPRSRVPNDHRDRTPRRLTEPEYRKWLMTRP